MRITTLLIGLILVISFVAYSQNPRLPATATDFDRSFGLAGIATLNFGTSVDTSDGVVTRDGNIVVVGRTFFPTSDVAVARFRRDGSVDSSFGINGSRVIPIGSGNDRGSAVYELPDGRLLIAGTFFDGTITNSFVLRLTGNGSLDVSFGNGGISTVPSTLAMQACCIAISGEGNPIIAGIANTSFTTYSFSVLRFLPNGGIDGSFGINGRILTNILGLDGPSAMCVSPDGRILVVGASSESASSSAHMTLARYLSNGVLDVSFNGSGIIRYTGFVSSELRAVSVEANGSILVAGRTVGANSNFLLARYQQDGTIDLNFGINGFVVSDILGQSDVVRRISIQKNRKIVAFGTSVSSPTVVSSVARYLPNGILDSTFGQGGYFTSDFALVSNGALSFGLLQSDGRLLLVAPNESSRNTILSIARLIGDTVPSAPDFDGDGQTDFAIFRPSTGQWWLNQSRSGLNVNTFGSGTDKIVYGDYSGDGRTDIAVFRPLTGEWFVLRSGSFTYYSFPFGAAEDIPLPGDYEGDGTSDVAVYRPSNSTWYIQRSTGGTTIQTFGASTDRPVPADYDGDGKTDIAIYRPSLGQWWLNRSTSGLVVHTFGNSLDKAVPGDFTGDGKSDVAIWRPSTGEWFVLRSEDSSFYSFPFGSNGDIPVPGDYDGDGRTDAGVFRPSSALWYLNRSTSGVLIREFGLSTDLPVPAAFIR